MVLPRRCPVCREMLQREHRYVCTMCLVEAPLTNLWLEPESKMSERVKVLRPEIEIASSLIYYNDGDIWRESIHRLKYRGEWRYCIHYGEWLGSILKHSPYYQEVDAVVAIPLHPRRQLERGYNQSEYIAKGVARAMGIEHLRSVVRRSRYNVPQVSIHRDERWRNVEDLFEVSSIKRLKGRNILLVDDVFTTGATMMSCAEVILDSVVECRIWIATVAVSGHEFGIGSR